MAVINVMAVKRVTVNQETVSTKEQINEKANIDGSLALPETLLKQAFDLL